MRFRRSGLVIFSSALVLSIAMPFASVAQEADESESDVPEEKPAPPPAKVEPAGAVELRDALRRIAVRPSDSYALTDAGYASLKLGDADAAFNFFSRASNLQPSDPRIKAGLAAAMVRRENPFEALRLFDEAARLGASERSFAMDRALAFDLLGNFERAQQDYQNARSYQQSDELIRRQAISLSLLGKSADADAMLYPLLQRDDSEAWRARTFILASRGEAKEAEKIARSFLTEPEAMRLEYYLRQMPRLTPAQQAAALHFGHFPTGGTIGQDSEQVRVAASAMGVKPRPAVGQGRLVPAGEPLGSSKITKRDAKKPREAKPAKADVRTAKRGDPVPLATSTAQAAVDRAAAAAPRMFPGGQLPPPEAARPLIRIVLPAAKPVVAPAPVPIKVATIPAPQSLPGIIPPKPAASPVLIESKPATVPVIRPIDVPPSNQPTTTVPVVEAPRPVVAELPPVGPAVMSRNEPVVSAPKAVTVDAPPVFSAPAPAVPAVTNTAISKIESTVPAPAIVTPKPETIVAGTDSSPAPQPQPQPQPPVAVPTGPGFTALDVPATAKPLEPVVTPIVDAPTPAPSLLQGPNPDGTVITASAPPVVEAATLPSTTRVEPPPSAAPEKPAERPAFDLGSIVESIAIPEQEQVRAVAPVDLKKIKPVAPKAEDAAKADGSAKAGKAGKVAANPARIWVQIATGADGNGLLYDYRRWAKKAPPLFTTVAGYTAVWSKSRRLLVGPFADMKAAKKWEADFRKNGGDGFVWTSENGVAVDPLKGK
jgi:Flp pilus assembly protein TadD